MAATERVPVVTTATAISTVRDATAAAGTSDGGIPSGVNAGCKPNVTSAAKGSAASPRGQWGWLLRTLRLALQSQPLTATEPPEAAGLQGLGGAAAPAATGSKSAATRSTVVSPSVQSTPPPIVFLHGIGIGVMPYQKFLDELSATCSDRPLLVLEYKHVSMRLTHHVPRWDFRV